MKLENNVFVYKRILLIFCMFRYSYNKIYAIGVDRLSAPILSILPIIDIGHFQNRFADNFF